MPAHLRRVLWVTYGVYLGWVAFLVWAPSPSVPSRAVAAFVSLAQRAGVGISPTLAEFALNVVMLVPLSLIGGLLLRGLRTSDWIAIGFVTSSAVEVVQRLVLPTRSGSSRDIVANTLGALVGAVLLSVVLGLLARRAPDRDGPPQAGHHS